MKFAGMTLISSLVGVVLLLGCGSSAFADSVRRIVHPDGRVEYTNAPAQNRARPSTQRETVYKYRDQHGVVTFSEARPDGADYDVIRFECYACRPDSRVDWHRTPLFLTRYVDEIEATAREFEVDPALVRAVIHAESAFNPQAVSSKGAQGLMQLMPGTAREVGVSNALDASENIRGGVTYLSQMLHIHGGDTRLATAAYNAGPGAVRRHGGIPPYAETRAYVERVGILHQRYQQSDSH
ncbi:Transglycosylase SLT domain-containing protein [Marinobacter daqiaonensis]|uniref:Transglycosylase SLT domain-containing protein n=1 Tax=Marinobacter daqiaonensis TaxID=650891 RepID=A0A1I6GXI1_9GAMM|nr:lytic transglycosylase domain-containing protein [Marinobacter daqiaonensis]SFR46954.1 Transglycosylase SLT domain-containing protein [Marinobacter daqiaonensis]